MTKKNDFRATMAELLPALTAERDARIESRSGGLCVVMDDDGHGEFTRVCTEREAAALVAEGYCRDARDIVFTESRTNGTPEIETTVCGADIQVDRSGVGHAWTTIDAVDIPANIRQEIEGEIIDGGKTECERFRASNGLYYRW